MGIKSDKCIIQIFGSAKYCFSGNTTIELFVVKETEGFFHGYEAYYNVSDKQYDLIPGKMTVSKSSVNGFCRKPKFDNVYVGDRWLEENVLEQAVNITKNAFIEEVEE